jgi:endonuclease YncB( thermonuclease family)
VRDGDTIVVRGTPVRLAGLHCPELRERGGKAAADAMRSLVSARAVYCALRVRFETCSMAEPAD